MATKRMLVDATHPEETRIVVTSGNRLDEFDFESAERRQLRGNIYLAKVTRVEPSLQAAFVEYGGNRHGFLAFSEIHPDYYQIPVSDREALMRDEEEEDRRAAAREDKPETVSADAGDGEDDVDSDGDEENGAVEVTGEKPAKVDEIGGADSLEDLQERPRRASRRYKIQEVIKRRQVLLVQVVKEERGNKGAALTTYLSLAGRYSVLMPNTARGGGISRKITSAADRKRLKEIAGDLEVPNGMGVILRTAGASRTKAEVKRDFEYLMRLWENVRTLTLRSSAPSLVYEEGSLIKRTIRDLYNKDIAEVVVAGDEAYREAKDFMRMIMPSHAKNVQAYKDDAPVFSKFGIEAQLDSMFHPQVTLPSGGYIVINPTEALVSIDVNSGRATKEHNIEDTALQTNLEAAEEISRQLRLRDLAGLIVIDFIDMEERRNNRAVEKKLKDCLKNDRARIQIGHISHFGLMEMSRQRMRHGVLESSTHTCPTCAGTGLVRSVPSVALMVMRAIEDNLLRKPGQSINVKMASEVALYILNFKRQTLGVMEAKYAVSITVLADNSLGGGKFEIEKGESRAPEIQPVPSHIRADAASMADYDDAVEDEIDETLEDDVEAEESEGEETAPIAANGNGDGSGRRNRRRRRRRGGNGETAEAVSSDTRTAQEAVEGTDSEADGEDESEDDPTEAAGDLDGEPRRRRRRGRRGGRRNRRLPDGSEDTGENGFEDAVAETEDGDVPAVAADGEAAAAPLAASAEADQPSDAASAEEAAPVAEDKPKRPRRSRKKVAASEADAAEVVTDAVAVEPVAEAQAVAEDAEPDAKPKRTRAPRRRKTADAEAVAAVEASASADTAPDTQSDAAPSADESAPAVAEETPVVPETASESKAVSRAPRGRKTLPADEIVVSSSAASPEEDAEDDKPKKVGWWQRRLGLG